MRSRSFSIVTYLAPQQLEQILLLNSKDILRYAYIVHDKDLNEDNTPKRTHIHLYLYFNNKKSVSQIKDMLSVYDTLDIKINSLIQIAKNQVAVIQYFTHQNEPKKVQYEEDFIFSKNLNIQKILETRLTVEDKSTEIVTRLLNNEDIFELCQLFGRDFIYHIDKFERVCELIRIQRVQTNKCAILSRSYEEYFRGDKK